MNRNRLLTEEANNFKCTNDFMNKIINDNQTTCEIIKCKYKPSFQIKDANSTVWNYFILLHAMKISPEYLNSIESITLTIGGVPIWKINFQLILKLSKYSTLENKLYFPKQFLFNNEHLDNIPLALIKYHKTTFDIEFKNSSVDIDLYFIKMTIGNETLLNTGTCLQKFNINQYDINTWKISPQEYKFYLHACKGVYVTGIDLKHATLRYNKYNVWTKSECIIVKIDNKRKLPLPYIKLLSKLKLPYDVITSISDYLMDDPYLYYIQFEQNNDYMYFPNGEANIIFNKSINILGFVSINILLCLNGLGGTQYNLN